MSREKDEISRQLISIFENIMKVEHESILSQLEGRLSITEVHTIAAIGVDDLCSMTEIAGKLKITMGTLTVAINNLVKKGYAERHKSQQDRRIVKIGLSKQGKEVYRIHKEFHSQLAQAMTQGFTQEENRVVERAVSNIEAFVEKGYKELEML